MKPAADISLTGPFRRRYKCAEKKCNVRIVAGELCFVCRQQRKSREKHDA